MRKVDEIAENLKYLPVNDIEIGKKLLIKRDFIELQMLVDSAIVKTRYNVDSPNPKEIYLNVDMKKLQNLSVLIFEYREQLIESIIQDDDEDDDEISEGDLYSMDEDY